MATSPTCIVPGCELKMVWVKEQVSGGYWLCPKHAGPVYPFNLDDDAS